jgi:quercetin dioxygenase-like cupin family protein
MSDCKYAKFIITEPLAEEHGYEQKDGPDVMAAMAYLDGGVLENAFYVETHWFKKPTQYSPKKHAHDFDETLGFFGGDPEHPLELNGEVELWIEDEKHLLNKSCLVYIPAGVNHCPMHVRPTGRPIFHFSTGTSTKPYKRED